jgi:SAM-dependent methyltransferase
MVAMSLREAWERNATRWIEWSRRPGLDSYDQFHGRRFLEIVPPPGRLTLDIGAGEGRLARDLRSLGHRVVALDSAPSLAQACAAPPSGVAVAVADAARVPFSKGCADLVIAFMSLQDMDDYATAISEVARLLFRGGRLCFAIVHPINSAGRFEGARDDLGAPFVIGGSYLETFRYLDEVERDGLEMSFHGEHRPIEAYFDALRRAGFVVEDLREITLDDPGDRWARIPLFLHVRAVRT